MNPDKQALASYDQAIRLDPSSAAAYEMKRHALEQLGKKREAQSAFEKALQLNMADK